LTSTLTVPSLPPTRLNGDRRRAAVFRRADCSDLKHAIRAIARTLRRRASADWPTSVGRIGGPMARLIE
jgi:hypothetical protein